MEDTMTPKIENTQENRVSQKEFQGLLQTKLREAVRFTLMTILDEEVEGFIGAGPYQRTSQRRDYRNGTYSRDLGTGLGVIEDLVVPRTRKGFRTQVFERYQRRRVFVLFGDFMTLKYRLHRSSTSRTYVNLHQNLISTPLQPFSVILKGKTGRLIMETEWYQARACLRHLRKKHPAWTLKQLAQEMGYSYNWVRKWCKRLAAAPPDDATCLCSLSRARKTPPPPIAPEVVKVILTLRHDPPEGLQRTPGPVAIKYYLPRDQELQVKGYHLPTSTSTIWRILDQHGCIQRPTPRAHEPVTRAAPLQAWQIDFKDVTTVTGASDDKHLHLVETLDVVDSGTSLLLDNPARPDFNAETAIASVVATLRQHGCPQKITFDRDPRFVGSWTADDFPSPLMRLLLCLGIEPEVCPPHRPDKNAFVERYHRSYAEEAIQVYQPTSLPQVQEMNQTYQYHYNYQRPNQALSCGNQPPRHAFPDLPALPPLPPVVDPARWLEALHEQTFKRRVDAAGTIRLDKDRYYIGRERHKQTVLLKIEAPQRQINVLVEGEVIKTMPLKGLTQQPMPFDDYVNLIQTEAISQWRHYVQKARRYVRLVT
jgi:hypothetical protein